MWVFLSNSFLSIVEHSDRPDSLLVRSRLPDDIAHVFPEAKVFVDNSADYKYRAILPRERVAEALNEAVNNIHYTNFKNSVADKERHNAYLDVWSVMNDLQGRRR